MLQRLLEMLQLLLEELDFLIAHPGIYFLQSHQSVDFVTEQFAPVTTRLGEYSGNLRIGSQFRQLQHPCQLALPRLDNLDGGILIDALRLLDIDEQMKERIKPGLEGVAKITISEGERSYAWLWTHKMVNWVRMKLWI